MSDGQQIAAGLFVAGLVVAFLRWLADRHIKRIDKLATDALNFITRTEVDVQISGLLKKLDEISKEGIAGDKEILASITEVRRDVTHEMRELRNEVSGTHRRIDGIHGRNV